MTCFRTPTGQTVRKYCKEHGLLYYTVWTRLDRGMTFEEAIAYKPDKPHYKLVYNGKQLSKICKGTKTRRYRRIANYMYRGKTLKEAVEYDQKHFPTED